MEALQVITTKKKLLAESKVRQDREKRLQKQSEEKGRQALAALHAARQQRELNINNTVMEKLSVDQFQGRESLADQDRMTQIIQQLNLAEAHYDRIINNEDDGEEEVELLQDEIDAKNEERRTNLSTSSTSPQEPGIISRRGLICRNWDTRMTTCCTAILQVRSTCK